MKTYIWLIIESIYFLISGLNFTLINFLLWEKQSIEVILYFNLIVVSATLLNTVIGGFLQRILGTKFAFLAVLLLQGALSLLALENVTELNTQLISISLLLGLSYGFSSNSRSTITKQIVNLEQQVGYSSKKEIILSIFAILSPLIVKLLIDNLGYAMSFQIITAGYSFLAFFFIFLKLEKVTQIMVFPRLLIKSMFHKPTRDLSKINFSIGLGNVYGLGLLNIIILEVLGSLDSWSNLSFLLAITGIILTNVLKKIGIKNQSKSKAIIMLGTLFYAIAPIILISNFTVTAFIAFTFIKLLFDKTNNIVTYNYLDGVENTDPDYNEERLSYAMFNNFYYNLGSLLPIVALLIIPRELLSIEVLIIGFAITSLMPLFFSKSYNSGYIGYFDSGTNT